MNKKNILLYTHPIAFGEELWVSIINGNGICRLNFSDKYYSMINKFQVAGSTVLYSEAIMQHGKIFFVPFNSNRIAVYSILEDSFSYYDLKINHKESRSLFYKAVSDFENIYFIPCRYNKCIKINTTEGSFAEFDILWKEEKKQSPPYFLKAASILEKQLIIGFREYDSLKFVSLEDFSIRQKQIPYALNGISNLECNNNGIWIFGKNGRIVRFDPNLDLFEKYDDLFDQDYSGVTSHGFLFETLQIDKNIYITHSFSNKISKLNTTDKTIITQMYGEKECCLSHLMPIRFPAMYQYGSYLNILDGNSGKTYCILPSTFELIDILPEVSFSDLQFKLLPDTNGIVNEVSYMNLEKYITHI
ncbi:MAG: hypothetical protein E7302_04320 [Butyrivibrio sp.]|nr:hypothetical protein [Butyrivibrio sp.]